MLDHGLLNLPLSKRGNIDAQIDRYKADVARQDREADKVRSAKIAAGRIEAKALLVSDRTDAIAKRIAAKAGITPAAVRRNLKSEAHWRPQMIIRLFAEDAAKAAA